MTQIDEAYISGRILKEPDIENGSIRKGAIILSQCDYVVSEIPKLMDYFYIIERRGWEGINESKCAEIKLVEDLSTWEDTVRLFPNAILLPIGPADFVDTNAFKPLGIEKKYSGIQISSWDRFKRPFLFLEGIALLPEKRFLRLGHLVRNGDGEEILLKKQVREIIRKENIHNIEIPHLNVTRNPLLPGTKEEINYFLNQSKMGILTTQVEGINRFKMECLSSDIPVLVPSDASVPTRKHINDRTGLLFEPTPSGLIKAIQFVEDNYEQFSPRNYVLENTGIKTSLDKLINKLNVLSKEEGAFDDITWDGRNQSLDWGKEMMNMLKVKIENYDNG